MPPKQKSPEKTAKKIAAKKTTSSQPIKQHVKKTAAIQPINQPARKATARTTKTTNAAGSSESSNKLSSPFFQKVVVKSKEIAPKLSSSVLYSAIPVDLKFCYVLPNGLVDVNRDIFIKLIKIIEDGEKIKHLIGMTGQFYMWSKHKNFRYARIGKAKECPIVFVPKKPLRSGVTYTGTKITHRTEGFQFWSVYIEHDLTSPGGIFLVDVLVSGWSAIGLASKSHFLDCCDFREREQTCAVLNSGIWTGGSRACGTLDFWDPQESYLDGHPPDHPPPSVALELNQRKHTVHFFSRGTQIPHCVINVPRDVCFALGATNPADRKSVV